jgi:hypothetical protein
MIAQERFHLSRPPSREAENFAAGDFMDSLEIDPFFVNSEKIFLLSEKKIDLRFATFHELNLDVFHSWVQ